MVKPGGDQTLQSGANSHRLSHRAFVGPWSSVNLSQERAVNLRPKEAVSARAAGIGPGHRKVQKQGDTVGEGTVSLFKASSELTVLPSDHLESFGGGARGHCAVSVDRWLPNSPKAASRGSVEVHAGVALKQWYGQQNRKTGTARAGQGPVEFGAVDTL